jgi:2-keto-4-pentenoate hydratase/2-oxohepta-3-ene-1,7-dioic acid hydratase in catechol pathway
MKLVTFNDGQVGRIADDQVIELDAASTREFFERDQRVGETGRRYPLAEVRLRAPIAPKKFFHTAGNFREHHEDLARVNWSHPVNKGIVFFQNVDAIIGPGDPVVYPG